MPTISVSVGGQWVPFDTLSQDKQELIKSKVSDIIRDSLVRQLAKGARNGLSQSAQ